MVVTELLLIEGLGPKRIKMLHDNLDIKNSADLKRALVHADIEGLHGFGKNKKAYLSRHQNLGTRKASY